MSSFRARINRAPLGASSLERLPGRGAPEENTENETCFNPERHGEVFSSLDEPVVSQSQPSPIPRFEISNGVLSSSRYQARRFLQDVLNSSLPTDVHPRLPLLRGRMPTVLEPNVIRDELHYFLRSDSYLARLVRVDDTSSISSSTCHETSNPFTILGSLSSLERSSVHSHTFDTHDERSLITTLSQNQSEFTWQEYPDISDFLDLVLEAATSGSHQSSPSSAWSSEQSTPEGIIRLREGPGIPVRTGITENFAVCEEEARDSFPMISSSSPLRMALTDIEQHDIHHTQLSPDFLLLSEPCDKVENTIIKLQVLLYQAELEVVFRRWLLHSQHQNPPKSVSRLKRFFSKGSIRQFFSRLKSWFKFSKRH